MCFKKLFCWGKCKKKAEPAQDMSENMMDAEMPAADMPESGEMMDDMSESSDN